MTRIVHKFLNNFSRASCKAHSCQKMKAKKLFKEIVDAGTDGRTHARTINNGPCAIRRAHFEDIVLRWAKNVKASGRTCTYTPFQKHQTHFLATNNSIYGPLPQSFSISTTDQRTLMSNHKDTQAVSWQLYRYLVSCALFRDTKIHTVQQCWATTSCRLLDASQESQKYLQNDRIIS